VFAAVRTCLASGPETAERSSLLPAAFHAACTLYQTLTDGDAADAFAYGLRRAVRDDARRSGRTDDEADEYVEDIFAGVSQVAIGAALGKEAHEALDLPAGRSVRGWLEGSRRAAEAAVHESLRDD
jgi:hypothetical protein